MNEVRRQRVWRTTTRGVINGVISLCVLVAIVAGFDNHQSILTTALILAVPVIVGVLWGGLAAGVVTVVGGFFVYGFFFSTTHTIPWGGPGTQRAALIVYAATLIPVALMVRRMQLTRAREQRQGREIRQLFEMSSLLVETRPLDDLLDEVTTLLARMFRANQVAILLLHEDELEVEAFAGTPLSDAQVDHVRRTLPGDGVGVDDDTSADELVILDLDATDRSVGRLAITATAAPVEDRDPLLLFANQIALAVERAQLREEAIQVRLAAEVTRLAKILLAAVSHDLRTPLASIKASSSTLCDPDIELDPEVSAKLATLIDVNADRLADLVQSLLDMSRIQAGVLEPQYEMIAVADLVSSVVSDLLSHFREHELVVEIPSDLRDVSVDRVLMARVLTNLLVNALRHGPKHTEITIRARMASPTLVELSVSDHGPGVRPELRGEVFEFLARRETDGGAGLGLTIAKTFVEAHGQQIWVEDAPWGGACFCLTMPIAGTIDRGARALADSHH